MYQRKIYLNCNAGYTIMRKLDLGKEFGLTLNKRAPKEWSQDFVEEIKVKNGVVIREDQKGQTHYVKILELSAVNFMIMSPDEQDELIGDRKSVV